MNNDANSEERKALLALCLKVVESIALAERERIKAILLEHEPLAGAYIHDLIRAIDESDDDR